MVVVFGDCFENASSIPDKFFERHFVANYCPLVFMEQSARNRTPDKLPASERAKLDEVCDRHLQTVLRLLQPKHVVGVGAYAEKCLDTRRRGDRRRRERHAHPAPEPCLTGSQQRLGRHRHQTTATSRYLVPPPLQGESTTIPCCSIQTNDLCTGDAFSVRCANGDRTISDHGIRSRILFAEIRPRQMNADQFQDLYKLLRGSKAATAVLDARALFMEKRLQQAYQKLSDARESFAESRSRVLRQTPEQQLDPKARDADRQLKKLKRKQDKTIETIKLFDELLPQLEKLVERQQRHQELEDAREHEAPAPDPSDQEAMAPNVAPADAAPESIQHEAKGYQVARISDLSKELITALSDAAQEQRLDIINQHFGFREVSSDEDLHGDALYYIQTKNAEILASTPSAEQMGDEICLISVIDHRTIKPFSRASFLKLGTSRKMVLLTARDDREESDVEQPEPAEGDEGEQNLLDLGAFSQLLTSAQRSGLVSDADQIGYVRDREFRMGKYDLAFQTIDAMFARFMASSGQRAQNLAREDADIAAGRIKISPKDLQAKRTRDRVQTQEIDRAKRRFQVVLEGLRVLMNTES